jgi:hypothetical protein
MSPALEEPGQLDVAGSLGGGGTGVIMAALGADRPNYVQNLPPPTPGRAALTPRRSYTGPRVIEYKSAMRLQGRSWARFADCYEREKQFVEANARNLFATLAGHHPEWTTDERAFAAAMRTLVDFSAAAYRPQYLSALTGPQYARFLKLRSPKIWKMEFEATMDKSAEAVTIARLSAWDGALQRGAD